MFACKTTGVALAALGLALALAAPAASAAPAAPAAKSAAQLRPKLAAASAAGYVVQTKASQGNAGVGESGASVQSSALISIVVSKLNGHSAGDLGANVGDGSSAITLPAGWELFSNLNVPPGGCLLTPTQFYNWGDGAYNIRVVPFTGNAACKWLAGEYHYVVRIKNGAQTVGSGLGALKIN